MFFDRKEGAEFSPFFAIYTDLRWKAPIFELEYASLQLTVKSKIGAFACVI
jgi:hypothetical protein